MDFRTVLTEVDAWPVEDRLRLMEAIWSRLVEEGGEPGLTEDQRAEIERRLDRLDADPTAVVPWEVVEREARARFRS